MRAKKPNTASKSEKKIAAGNSEVKKPLVDERLKPLTPDEQAIAARVSAETEDWRTLTEGDMEIFSLGDDPFLPPPEAMAKEQARELKFRWVERNTRRLDQVRNMRVPLKWWVCNSTNTPFLARHLDPVTGSVNREDQILVFKPWWMWEAQKAVKKDMADGLTRSGVVTSKDKSRDGVSMESGVRSIEGKSLGRIEVSGGDVQMPSDPAVQAMIDQADGGRIQEGVEDLIDG